MNMFIIIGIAALTIAVLALGLISGRDAPVPDEQHEEDNYTIILYNADGKEIDSIDAQ